MTPDEHMAQRLRVQADRFAADGMPIAAQVWRTQADRLAPRCPHEYVRVSCTPFEAHDECVHCQDIRPIQPS